VALPRSDLRIREQLAAIPVIGERYKPQMIELVNH
jgi:hypothetical protein